MRHLAVLLFTLFTLFSLLLTGCASPRLAIQPDHLLNDHLFVAPATPINAEEIFALSNEMHAYLNSILHKQLQDKGYQLGLFEALRDKAHLKIEYDSVMTKKAAETFATHSGNCLSLVIMTAAFAKQLGLAVQFQNIITEEAWSRNGSLYFSAGHVNIVLGKKNSSWRAGYDSLDSLTIDFLPPEDLRGQQSRTIDERTIVAMYMNNRAAELLANKQVNQAYWFAREAILKDPAFLSAYNTLAVIYHYHGHLPQAEQVLREVLAKDANNTSAMNNLISVLHQQGQQAEANLWRAQLEKLQPYPPFYFFNLGKLAMDKGDFSGAKTLFTQELKRDPYYHEFHFWLALAHFQLGELTLAGEQLGFARDNSTTQNSFELYSAKLDRIKSYASH